MERAAIEARLDLVQRGCDERRPARERLRGGAPGAARTSGARWDGWWPGGGGPRDLGQLARRARRPRGALRERWARCDRQPPLLADALLPALRGHGALIDAARARAGAAPPIDASQGGYIAGGL